MNIVYLCTDFGIPVHGNKGASIHVRELSASLASHGHQVDIISCRAGGDPPVGFHVPVHEFPVEKSEHVLVGSLQDDPAASEPMAKEIRSMLYAATLRHRVMPLLQRLRPDAIYERYSLLGAAGVELARLLDIPHILEVNAPLSDEHATHRGIGFSQTIRATEQRTLGAADQVIAVSEQLRQWIAGAGVDAERVTVVPNGVDIDRFASPNGDVRTQLGLDDHPVVGFVGTLKAWHGTATLIQAVARLVSERGLDRAPRLLIVGDGPQRLHLAQLAADEGVTAITTFTGMVDHADMPSHIAAMDIAVAPYNATPDFYFSPLKLFEYMAAGRPVVAAGIGQIGECIRNAETGLLYPPGDVPELTNRIAWLLDDPANARAMGLAAQHEVMAHRSWSENARVVIKLIDGERAPQHQRLTSASRMEESH